MTLLQAATEILGHSDFVVIDDEIALNELLPALEGELPERVMVVGAQLASIRDRAAALQIDADAATARLVQFPNLEPDRFWFAVRAAGYEADVRAFVGSLNDPASPEYDPVAWAAASAKLDFAKYFERDHPLVEAAREAIGMSETELDALWQFAAS